MKLNPLPSDELLSSAADPRVSSNDSMELSCTDQDGKDPPSADPQLQAQEQNTSANRGGSSSPYPLTKMSHKFLIALSKDFATAVEAMFAIEEEFPFIDVTTAITNDGHFILTPKTDSTRTLLDSLTTLASGKIVNITSYVPEPRKFRAILEKILIGFPLQRLTDLPDVISAERCIYRPIKEETRQVLLVMSREPPDEINLGIFGTFRTRKYIPEPLRCYNCQRYGHHRNQCKVAARCAICSKCHPTDNCLTKFKNGEQTEPKCPNCGGKHHAWNLRCEMRRSLLSKPDSSGKGQPPQPRTFTRKIHDWSKPREPQHLNTSALSHEPIKASIAANLHTLSTPAPAPVATSPVSQPFMSHKAPISLAPPELIGSFLVNTIQLGLLALGHSIPHSHLQTLIDNILAILPHKNTSSSSQESMPSEPVQQDTGTITSVVASSEDFPPLPTSSHRINQTSLCNPTPAQQSAQLHSSASSPPILHIPDQPHELRTTQELN